MVTVDCEGGGTETVAEETGMRIRRGIPPHTDCFRLEGFAYASASREGSKMGTLQSILKDLDLKM